MWQCGIRYAEDGVIVRFCAAAGEDDFFGIGADERGHLFAGGFYGVASALAGGVDAGGIGKIGDKIREHGVQDGGVHRGGGVEV